MEQGPVLIITFTAQQIIFITDTKGAVVEGDKVNYLLCFKLSFDPNIEFSFKDKIKRVNHVWALCRDPTILDPDAAWRVMECAMHATDQFV